jgi:anti-sigma regulatory factor (Ser/Thr protein kinase)
MPARASVVLAILEALGLDSLPPDPAPAPPVFEAQPIRTMPTRLGLDLEIDTFVQPQHGGDFFSFVPVAPAEILVAAVDVGGNGPSATPTARYLQGWLRGRALASGPPRLDVLADDLNAELGFSGIEATWYLALLGSPRRSTLRYQALANSYPTPLMLVDEAGTTHPSLAESGSSQLTVASFQPPITLLLASDGMLRRLGGGDEQSGKQTLRRWQTGEQRRQSIASRFGAHQRSSVDEALAVIRWSPWDDRYVFDVADDDARHEIQRDIRTRAKEVLGGHVDDLGRALAEALHNSLTHAYRGQSGRVEVLYRSSAGRVDLEIRDDGDGAFGGGKGMAMIRESCAAQFFRTSEHGHVVSLRCTLDGPR